MREMHEENDSQDHNEDDGESTPLKFLQALTEARAKGEIFENDRRVLLAYADNPGASCERLGEILGWATSTVYARLANPRLTKFKQLINGYISEKMATSADEFASWLLETMRMANRPVQDIITDIEREISDKKLARKTVQAAMKRIDPFIVAKLGDSLMRHSAEQAKLQAAENSRLGHTAGAEPLRSTPEALAILEADVITSPVTPTLDVKPIGS